MMKINMSMSMGFLKPITNFFKKYTSLLPAIVITVIALLLVLPTMLIGNSVKEQMAESVRTANTVSSLLRDAPSRQTPQLVKNYMDQLEAEADKIEGLAIESSMRDLISYDIFPPQSTSSQLYVAFGNKYRTAVEAMVEKMNARDAPSDAEIRNKTGDMRATSAAGRTAAARRETVNPMVDALCMQRAQEISVYAHPAAFPWYEFWESYDFAGEKQALEDCWDTQVAFWIYQDVADTIEAMNAGSNSVGTSPVKRLMGVSFTERITADTIQRSNRISRGEMRQPPNYVILPADETTASTAMTTTTNTIVLPSNFVSIPLTGRSTNEDIDVIHFAFSVLIDNRYVMEFMKELCSEKQHTYRMDYQENGQVKNAIHNQITILDADLSAVDKAAPEHELYCYGDGAVIQLDLICEYQFYRKGYDSIKPDPIKKRLGQPIKESEQTAATEAGLN